MSSFITSCDESDSKLIQKIDDDKIELMGHASITDFPNATLGRYGQIRSPFEVEYREDYIASGRQLNFGIDGEFFELRNCKKLKFQLDPTLPKIKVLKRNGYVNPFEQGKEVLAELKNEF
jgi:hypothetical protein